MTDLITATKTAMEEIAQLWTEYIEEGTNVQPLAPSTLWSKIAKGSIAPDTPLVDTQEMINSIEFDAEEVSENEVMGSVGGTDWKWVYHEYGLGPPERPTLRPVWDANIDEKLEDIADNVWEQLREEFTK